MQAQYERVECRVITGSRGDLIDFGKPRVGDGPMCGRQPPRFGHFQGRVVGWVDVAVVFGVPVDAAESCNEVFCRTAPPTSVATSDGVGFGVFSQLVNF